MACTTRRAAAGLASSALLLVASDATAEPTHASLSVQRDVGAETCAGEAELAAQIETIAGARILSGTDPKPVHLDVHIRRVRKGFAATVDLSGARTGSRSIDDDGPGCDALSQALAVTIAVLLDAGAEETAHTPKPPKTKQPYTPAEPTPEPPKEPQATAPPLALTAGGFYDFGTLDGSAGGITFSLDAIIPIISFGLAFVGLPYAPADRPNSPIVYRFLAGRARICTRQPYLELFGASLCAGLLAGQRRGETDDDASDGAFLAVVTQLEVSRRIVGPFGLYADLGLTIPFYREPLIIGAVTLREQPVTFQMGAGVRFWIGK